MTPPHGGFFVLRARRGGDRSPSGGEKDSKPEPGINADSGYAAFVVDIALGKHRSFAGDTHGAAIFVGGRVDRYDEELRNLSAPLPDQLRQVRDWIVSRHAWTAEVGLDTDLIESRLIDSVEFAEFLFTLEEITGNLIDLASVDLNAFRSLRSIESHFLRRTRDAT